MQVDGKTFGIIPDTFNTILSNYTTPLLNTFPNANSPNSPIYALMYVTSSQDQLLQSALVSLWNAINSNTAQGLGLNILANTVLNLKRPTVTPAATWVNFVCGPIYSTCDIQITVTGGGAFPYTIPVNWAATPVTTNDPYLTQETLAIAGTGTYYITCYSIDTSTPVPAFTFTGGTAVSDMVFTATNVQAATLGSLTIPTTWYVTNTTIADFPQYSPSTPITLTTEGFYGILVYSNNSTIPIGAGQLNSPSENVLPQNQPITDAQFSALRKYYLNVEGQTYYGLEKAIFDLGTPGLTSVNIEETITDQTNFSFLIAQVMLTVSAS